MIFYPKVPQPRQRNAITLDTLNGLGSFRFARRYSGNHGCFLFLKVLRCFSSLRLLVSAYEFSRTYPDITLDRLPDSEIPGSKAVTALPRLIAGSHVLHRLLVPRHPRHALCNLTKNLILIQIAF